MRYLRVLRITTFLLPLAQGCATTIVTPPKPDEIARVQPGMNRAQVLNLLGLPNDVEKRIGEGGAVTWIWTYYFEAYAGLTLALPYAPAHIPTNPSHPKDGARIVWTLEGTVAEVRHPKEQR